MDTRWNTYTDVLERGLDLKDVLSELCDMAQFNKGTGRGGGKGLRLCDFIISDDEWDVLEQLHRLLAVHASHS